LFPYTTLFRSIAGAGSRSALRWGAVFVGRSVGGSRPQYGRLHESVLHSFAELWRKARSASASYGGDARALPPSLPLGPLSTGGKDFSLINLLEASFSYLSTFH